MTDIIYPEKIIMGINSDIKAHFPHLKPIERNYQITQKGVQRMVMLDRYAQKDKALKTLKISDFVIVQLSDHAKFPTKATGYVTKISPRRKEVHVAIDDEHLAQVDPEEIDRAKSGKLVRPFRKIEKPLEIFWEQISYRVGHALAIPEKNDVNRQKYGNLFSQEIKNLNIVPAGRVLYGAGSLTQVTYFNCFVMPFIADSRTGISEHRKEVMEIMSRGGGVGTNGSTLRPRGAVAKTVGGKSSGAVSWLNDLANLTNLVEQGGSRRGAQMIMLADWHPDIIEFIISKMQNPRILEWLMLNSPEEIIREEARNKLEFVPLHSDELKTYEKVVTISKIAEVEQDLVDNAQKKLDEKGAWKVINPEFLSGANISITISDDFMKAIKEDKPWDLSFPDLANYTPEEKRVYDAEWKSVGDVREWKKMGHGVRVYRTISARALWDLINFCATYSAEPGIFFIDTANYMTNARSYGQKVIATNPCGEQPLAPYSVCNLAAVNLANFVDLKKEKILWKELAETVSTCVRMQDNVIDCTPYFIEANRKQALGERRVGLGIMGLHDMLIYLGLRYGSPKGNKVVDKLMRTIAVTAYDTSIELSKEKGSFEFLESRDKFIESGYVQQLPNRIKNDILQYGIRNSHLLTIAPTGSTGTMVGVSTGLEPYFAFTYYRSGRLGKNIQIEADIVRKWRALHPEYDGRPVPSDIFVSSMELSPEEHTDIQCIIQRWVDSSISKTVNAPRNFSVHDVEKIYMRLYDNGAKGGTVYVDGSRESQVLSLSNEDNIFSEQLKIPELKTTEQDITSSREIKDLSLRFDRQGREMGIEMGNICPICKEGTVVEAGGCNTCSNCGAQLKCGL